MFNMLKFQPLFDTEDTGGSGADATTGDTVTRDAPQVDVPSDSTTETPTSEAKTFTQDELNRHIANAKAQAKKAALAQAKADADKANMTEVDRLKAEKAETDQALADARAEALNTKRQLELTGKVSDAAAALKLLDDSHVNEDGTINLEALTKQYPMLAMQPVKPEPTPSGSGGTPKGVSSLDDLKNMTPEQINEQWDKIKNL